MKIIFSSYARQELNDATHYYEYELQGLGKLFRVEVRKAAKRIADYPESWVVEKGDVRKYLLHKFPYKLLYSIEKKSYFYHSYRTSA